MHKFRVQHETAIVEFRPYLHRRDQKQFDVACETLRQCREKLTPAASDVLRAMTHGGIVPHRTDIEDALHNINRLLVFANKV